MKRRLARFLLRCRSLARGNMRHGGEVHRRQGPRGRATLSDAPVRCWVGACLKVMPKRRPTHGWLLLRLDLLCFAPVLCSMKKEAEEKKLPPIYR